MCQKLLDGFRFSKFCAVMANDGPTDRMHVQVGGPRIKYSCS